MKLRPMNDKLVVKRKNEPEKIGSIIVPDNAKEKPREGEVLAVGNGKVLENGTVRPLDVKPGDVVLFAKYAGTELKVEGEDLLLLNEDEVLGIVEEA